MKLLLTAFEPFNGGTINPSQLVLEQVKEPSGMELVKVLLPVEFKRTTDYIKRLLQEYHPDVVLSLGQAGNRPEMKAGFIHVPFLPEQMAGRSSGFSMELNCMVKGIQAVLETLNHTR